MTKETWDAFLETMSNDPSTVVIDLTKKETDQQRRERVARDKANIQRVDNQITK
mgnify:CR=1 FL=1